MARLTSADRAALHQGRRRQILDAAMGVFAQRGYAAATIEDIARAAGVAEGTIYNYFRSKEDLLIRIPRHLAGPVFDTLAARLPDVRNAADAERALVDLGRAMIERVTGNVQFVKVFLSALPYLSPQAREDYMRLMPMAAAGILEAHLRAGVARGLYRADLEPAIAGRALPGMLLMFALSSEVLLGRRTLRHGYDTITREAARLFLYGVLTRPPARPAPHARAGASRRRSR